MGVDDDDDDGYDDDDECMAWKVTMSAWLGRLRKVDDECMARKVAEGCGRLQLRCIVIGLEVTKQKTKWIQRCECKARC